ncbi:MAG: DNA repair protein RecN [Bacteroidales bacterium]|nr:DNA repair protein RecN [Bacteroidales bacterium]
MLQSLHIQNYALISSLDMEFSRGLTTITGETGAGKSILLGALSLILGQRAETEVLRDKTLKCIVEGTFFIGDARLEPFFEQNDLDFQSVTVLRREINPNGKSRAFINDTPVTLAVLRELGLQLVDIHSQHENLELNTRHFQLRLVDLVAGTQADLEDYLKEYRRFRNLEDELHQLKDDMSRTKADLDYYVFQYQQLEDAKLREGELEELEEEQKKLSHAEDLRASLGRTSDILSGEGASVLQGIREALSLLSKAETYYHKAGALHQRLESVYIELKDLASEAERIASETELDPARLEFVNQRLDLLYELLQKHRVNSLQELIALRDSLKLRIGNITSSDERLEELEKEYERLKASLMAKADALSTARRKAIPGIETTVMSILKDLGIPNARFVITCEKTAELTPSGTDRIGFLFSANRSSEPMEVSKVASGGEISRLMLALKSIMAQSVTVPTIIFDEIDAGVSGEIAFKMGNLIQRMAEHLQVINITHLPQIAAKGHTHFLVYKKDQKQETNTYIKVLKPEERIAEIAKMLSGDKVTDASLENARELLGVKAKMN